MLLLGRNQIGQNETSVTHSGFRAVGLEMNGVKGHVTEIHVLTYYRNKFPLNSLENLARIRTVRKCGKIQGYFRSF